jgi:sterol desaturase/sphingolipid hydroxylase (fatty acid hydroxylase superfamily)
MTLYERIDKLPSTNFKILVGTVLFAATGIAIGFVWIGVPFIAMLAAFWKPSAVEKLATINIAVTPNHILLLQTWLAGILGFMGLAFAQFWVKRETFQPGSPDDRGNSATTAAPAGKLYTAPVGQRSLVPPNPEDE